MAGLTRGKQKMDARVAQKVAQLLTSSDPSLYAKGLKQVASNQTLLRALRSINFRSTRAAATEGND